MMVATFNNYKELVDRALMIEAKQKQIDNRKRKYGQGEVQFWSSAEASLFPVLGRTHS